MKEMLRITGRQAFEGVQLVVRVKVAESMGHPEVGESTVWSLMMPTDSGPMEAVGMQVVMVGAIAVMVQAAAVKKEMLEECWVMETTRITGIEEREREAGAK